MINKTKQLIISALICSINPIIAVSTMELIKQSASIHKEIKDMCSSLEVAHNQWRKNILYELLIEKNEEYKKKAIEIADQYKTKESHGNSLEYQAYTLLATAEIEQYKAMLAKENNTQTETDLKALWEDVSKKYEVAGEAFQCAVHYLSAKVEQWLYRKAGFAFRSAADYTTDQARKELLYEKAGIAYTLAEEASTSPKRKHELYKKAGKSYKLSEEVATDQARKEFLYEKARIAYTLAKDSATELTGEQRLFKNADEAYNNIAAYYAGEAYDSAARYAPDRKAKKQLYERAGVKFSGAACAETGKKAKRISEKANAAYEYAAYYATDLVEKQRLYQLAGVVYMLPGEAYQ